MSIHRVGIVFLTVLVLLFISRPMDACGQERANRGFSVGGVDVSELSPRVQDRALQLQKRGLNAFLQSDYLAAENLFRQALELTPSSYSLCNDIGVGYARRMRWTEAAEWIEKAHSMAPWDPQIAGNLGIIRWLQDRNAESYDLLLMAIEHHYTPSLVCYAAAVMALQKHRPLEAVRNLSKVHGKGFPYRYLYLALAQRELGKSDSAAKSWRKFLEGNRAPFFLAAYQMP
jgi:Tfp pilus assembly protein PilF